MDIAWLGLERQGEGEWSFELTPPLSRFDGKFYGGTGIAVTTAIMEAESGRSALWATVQFVGSADIGERFDCSVEVLAAGRRTSQLRMTATVGDRTASKPSAQPVTPAPDRSTCSSVTMPDVPSPHETPEWRPNISIPIPSGCGELADISELRGVTSPGNDGLMWARMRDIPQTRATLGFLADMVPSRVVSAAGRNGAGTSLDNAMRYGPRPDTEWILVDFDPYFAAGGYAHGGARLWSEDGTLLGVASQTATLLLFD